MPDDNDHELFGEPPDREEIYIEQAKVALLNHINENPEGVFYQRQLQLRYEGVYYHWVTARALDELAQDGVIRSELLTLRRSLMNDAGHVESNVPIRFFFWKGTRSWRRKASKVVPDIDGVEIMVCFSPAPTLPLPCIAQPVAAICKPEMMIGSVWQRQTSRSL